MLCTDLLVIPSEVQNTRRGKDARIPEAGANSSKNPRGGRQEELKLVAETWVRTIGSCFCFKACSDNLINRLQAGKVREQEVEQEHEHL